jgi:hypothetical protein
MGILQDNWYHSSENSETAGEGKSNKHSIDVYSLSLKSKEIHYFVLIYFITFY